MWLLILLSISINNPNDIPGIVTIDFKTEQECQTAIASITYWLKFDSFKVTAQCIPKKS